MLSAKTLKSILNKLDKKITPLQITQAQEKADKTHKTLEEVLVSDALVDENELYQKAALALKVPLVNLKGKEINKDILNLIPGPVAGTHQVVAFEKENNQLKLAMTDPTDIQTIEFLRRKTGLEPVIFITTPSDLKDAIRRYHAELKDEFSVVKQETGEITAQGDLKKAAEELPIINIVNSVLEHAVYENASDIHIEPEEKEVVIRYRIDGILKAVMTLPKNVQNGITARVKILSNLKLDEHMVPQDGRFKIQIQEEKLAFRVSILPVYDGEKIVMRLLHEGAKSLTLDELGFLESSKKKLESAIKKPHGMVLVTGPTGSGKTTTLYSILGILNQPGVNISTVEDPIEYRVNGVNQSQINPKVGFTFASGLRSLLRQDPNIIMVGEIRDQETADISINAAMTGHLVLSTLHTNDAPTTLPRLIDMGIPPFLVAYTVNIIIAQRLVRKICPYCKKEFILEGAALDELAKMFDIKKLSGLFKENIKDFDEQANSLSFYQGVGCVRCGQTGYKGRMGIYEVMEIDEGLSKKINERAPADEIKKYAREHGMSTMLEDGLVKAKLGITSINEILRVTKE
ncbi:MAG: ATPase, T2SS/T4P/T4SS family [Candidatus Magasanikbacteria bacterium]